MPAAMLSAAIAADRNAALASPVYIATAHRFLLKLQVYDTWIFIRTDRKDKKTKAVRDHGSFTSPLSALAEFAVMGMMGLDVAAVSAADQQYLSWAMRGARCRDSFLH